MEKFIKFLEANNAWENFEREFEKRGWEIKRYKSICKKRTNGELDVAFTWAETREGYKYWADLNRKWKEGNPLERETIERRLTGKKQSKRSGRCGWALPPPKRRINHSRIGLK